jgi:hypothetical protein
VCVRARMNERGREREKERKRERERESLNVCERERESVCVCACECVHYNTQGSDLARLGVRLLVEVAMPPKVASCLNNRIVLVRRHRSVYQPAH